MNFLGAEVLVKLVFFPKILSYFMPSTTHHKVSPCLSNRFTIQYIRHFLGGEIYSRYILRLNNRSLKSIMLDTPCSRVSSGSVRS